MMDVNAFERSADRFPSCRKIIASLKIKPELRLDAKEAAETQCGISRDTHFFARDAFNSSARDAARLGDHISRQADRTEKFFAQHFSWMQRRQRCHDFQFLFGSFFPHRSPVQ